jgi:hypothetical protein
MGRAAACEGGSEGESKHNGQRAFHRPVYTTRASAASHEDGQGAFRNTGAAVLAQAAKRLPNL